MTLEVVAALDRFLCADCLGDVAWDKGLDGTVRGRCVDCGSRYTAVTSGWEVDYADDELDP